MTRMISFIGAGPGDPELITLKGWRILQAADAILYDSLVDERLVAGLPGELLYVGKRCGSHSMPQEEINALLASRAWLDQHVARLKGGDPAVLGRVGEELLYVAERGIPFEVIPGVSSATAVPMFAGIPVTMRGVADSFAVATAHRRMDAAEFSIPPFNPKTTLVLLMALNTTPLWREQLAGQGYPLDLPLAFVSAGGTESQRVVISTVGEAEQAIRATRLPTPVLVVVGHVVSLRQRLNGGNTEGIVPVGQEQTVPIDPLTRAAQATRGNGRFRNGTWNTRI